jgi:hypothetical protein
MDSRPTAVRSGGGDRLPTSAGSQLQADAAQVRLDRGGRDAQVNGNRRGGRTYRHEVEHLALALRERLGRCTTDAGVVWDDRGGRGGRAGEQRARAGDA